MRTHLQGTFLLIVLLLVFWGMLTWAVPILDDAVFGDDGAIVGRAPLEVDDPADPERDLEEDRPLDGNEVADLQGALTQLGYSPGPIDGIMGELTRQAVDEAKADIGLAEASDRKLLETLEAALGGSQYRLRSGRAGTLRCRARTTPHWPRRTERPSVRRSSGPATNLNLKVTLMWVKTSQRRKGVGWWATETPEGPASVAFRAVGGEVLADAWGAGAEWAIDRVPALLGDSDDPSGFRPLHPVVRDLVARLSVPRLGATGRWFEAMATAAVYQRVVSADARTAVARMGRLYGAEVPGGPLPLFPRPEAVLRVPDHGFHRAGVDRGRARVIRIAAKHADRLEELDRRPAVEARQWQGCSAFPAWAPGPRPARRARLRATPMRCRWATCTCRGWSPTPSAAPPAATTTRCWSCWSPTPATGVGSSAW